jgi:hypothetical protein
LGFQGTVFEDFSISNGVEGSLSFQGAFQVSKVTVNPGSSFHSPLLFPVSIHDQSSAVITNAYYEKHVQHFHDSTTIPFVR